MVKNILAQNDLNVGLHGPNFVLALSKYVFQTELPRWWKIPKFTKLSRDTSESNVEYIAYYLAEEGDIASQQRVFDNEIFSKFFNQECIHMVYNPLPTFLAKLYQFEGFFHEQFYMGQSTISLKEFAIVRRKILDSLNKFRLF